MGKEFDTILQSVLKESEKSNKIIKESSDSEIAKLANNVLGDMDRLKKSLQDMIQALRNVKADGKYKAMRLGLDTEIEALLEIQNNIMKIKLDNNRAFHDLVLVMQDTLADYNSSKK